MELSSNEKDDAALEGLLEETCQSELMRIGASCPMPKHWHFVWWPERDGGLAPFLQPPSTEDVRCRQLARPESG